jgi:phosphoglycerol transferase MdoB-like AlkP superfamily enzyme
MNHPLRKYPAILIILKTYGLILSLFFVFRVILFSSEMDRINFDEVALITIFQSFIMGLRFDTVITGYIMLLPSLALIISSFFNTPSNTLKRIVFFWTFILFTICFVISGADIPYFNHFYSRFTIGAFAWFDNPVFVVSMILQEPKYCLIAIPFTIVVLGFYKMLKTIYRPELNIEKQANLFLKLTISLLLILIMLVSIRGRIEHKSPIRVGTAYFSDHSFLNKLGLNPVFTLMRSYLDSQSKENQAIQLMDDQAALKNVQHYLGISNPKDNAPIARKIVTDSIPANQPNVVLIIMESMSAGKMSRHGNPNNLTPFLDSLSHQSHYFENVYTSGKHTFNGIFSTLFSFPALYNQHPLKQIKKYNGLSTSLIKHGYSTTYFTTHDSQFDNVEGFLRANDFQNVISQANYPAEEIKSTLGVPDDYMFRYSIPKLNALSKQGQPFLATFMTTSDHGPYYIPDYFTPKTTDIKQQIVEYADWSIQQFISLSKKTTWFDNTLFVLIADHGGPLNAKYDIALNYHHTPLIFYAPKHLQPKTFANIGGQIDVYPTLMGMLNLPYLNNTLGIDLRTENRPYILINDDDKFGVLDTTHLLIVKKNEVPKLYNYQQNELTNSFESNKEKATKMETYGKSNLQVFQWMLLNDKTHVSSE